MGGGSRVKCLDSLFCEGVNVSVVWTMLCNVQVCMHMQGFQASASKVTRKDKCVAF